MIGNKTVGCWLGLRALKTFYFCKVIKKNTKLELKAFLQRILQEIVKKIILGTSGAWSMRQLSNRPSKLVYYIEDFQTTVPYTLTK